MAGCGRLCSPKVLFWAATFWCSAEYINTHLLFRWYCLLTAFTHYEPEERFFTSTEGWPRKEKGDLHTEL